MRTPADQRNLAQIERRCREDGARNCKCSSSASQTSPTLAGQDFTMGDIVVGVTVYRWYGLEVKRPRLVNIEAYYARLQQRARPAKARQSCCR